MKAWYYTLKLLNDRANLLALLTAICHCLLKLGIIQLMIFAALSMNYKLKTAVQASCRMILANADVAGMLYIWQKTERNKPRPHCHSLYPFHSQGLHAVLFLTPDLERAIGRSHLSCRY